MTNSSADVLAAPVLDTKRASCGITGFPSLDVNNSSAAWLAASMFDTKMVPAAAGQTQSIWVWTVSSPSLLAAQ